MYKLVTIDLDGTLFDKKKNISKLNKEAIKKARELGVYIVIATGRPYNGAYKVLEELGLTTNNDYVILYNGAKILNVGTHEEIYSATINGKDVKDLFVESKRLNTFIHAFRLNEELICHVHNPYTDVEASINNIVEVKYDFNDIKDDDLFLKCMFVDSEENVTKNIENVNPLYKEKYSMVRSSKIFLEFLNPNCHKGYALRALAKYLNIDMKDTMAIGDAGNDLKMIEFAGLGVGMENAFPEVLNACDVITTSNENDGVGNAIYKYIINEK